jgi:hypothetical protein
MINEALYYDNTSNVYLVSFDTYLPVVFGLRNMFVKFQKELNKQGDIKSIKDKLYEFITSDEFKNYFSIIKANVRELELIFKQIQTQTSKGIGEINNIGQQVDNLIEVVNKKT